MGALDTAGLRDELKAIGEDLIQTANLTAAERDQVKSWTVDMGLEFVRAQASTGEDRAAALKRVENYRTALNGMIGVVELRAAQASEKALARALERALGIALKAAIAALL